MDAADVTLAQGQEWLAQGQPAKALAVFTDLLERGCTEYVGAAGPSHRSATHGRAAVRDGNV